MGAQINTQRLKGLTYDSALRTISFQSGVQHADLYPFANRRGRVTVGG